MRYVAFLRYASLIICSLPIVVLAQTSVNQRLSSFYTHVGRLAVVPEELRFNTVLSPSLDSAAAMYSALDSVYLMREKELTQEQHIFWLYTLASLQQLVGNPDVAIEWYKKALYLQEGEEKELLFAQLKIKLADAYRHSGLRRESNEVLLEVVGLPGLKADSARYFYCLNLIAENHENLGQIEDAQEVCLRVYSYYLRHQDLAKASYNLIQLGRLGAFLSSDTSYFEFFHLANRMAVKSGDIARIQNNLVNTARAYSNGGYPEMGLPYIKHALQYQDNIKPYSSVYGTVQLATTYLQVDSIMNALVYARQALLKAKEINANGLIVNANEILASGYINQGQYDSASTCLHRALAIKRLMKNNNYSVGLYKNLSLVNREQGKYEVAMAYLDSMHSEYTRFVSTNYADKLAQLRMQSNYELNRARIAELVLNNQLSKTRNNKLIIIIISVGFVLLLSVLFAILSRKRLRELRQSYVNLIRKSIELDSLNKKLNEPKKKTKKKLKKEDQVREDEIIEKLQELFNEKEIFINPDLTLKRLADKLHTNTSYLSAAINAHYNCNFSKLINQFRINKARKMLVSDEFKHYSVEGICTEVGFHSRTVFYQAFKSFTGLSPSQYVKNYKKAIVTND